MSTTVISLESRLQRARCEIAADVGKTMGLQRILDMLAAFYPTGSRFMDTATPESDYDFFVEDTKLTYEKLKAAGFEELGSHSYLDQATSRVLRFTLRDIQIDVQLIHAEKLKAKIHANTAIKLALQDGLISARDLKSKCDASNMWRAVIRAYVKRNAQI